MKDIRIVAMVLLVMGYLSGCSKSEDGGTPPAQPLPPANTQEAEPNDSSPQALGTLGSSDIVLRGSSASTGDVDRYSIVLGGTANLFASIAFTSGDLDLAVQNSSGITLTFRDTGTQPEKCTLTARSAGTYIIQVTSKTASATEYNLTVGPR